MPTQKIERSTTKDQICLSMLICGVCVCVTSTTTFWQKTTQNTWANWTFSIQIAMLPFLVPLFSRISLPGLGLGSSGTFAEAKEKATSAWTSHGNWYHYRYSIGWFCSKVAKTSHHQYQWWSDEEASARWSVNNLFDKHFKVSGISKGLLPTFLTVASHFPTHWCVWNSLWWCGSKWNTHRNFPILESIH